MLHDGFSYRSLHARAVDADDPLMSPDAGALFSALKTEDFERVLERVQIARDVSMAIGGNDLRRLESCYSDVRDALVRAVAAVHVERRGVPDAALRNFADFMSKGFGMVFTTNYDLLTYWALMKQSDVFTDFFWPKDHRFVFDLAESATPTGRVPIFYLHGALMLFETHDGLVQKLVNTDGSPFLLGAVLESITAQVLPVFVSEGTAEEKRQQIARHAYLEFCLQRLKKSGAPMTVFGHGLGTADAHVVGAVAGSGRREVQISLWPTSLDHLDAERTRIEGLLSRTDRTVEFFDQRTLDPWTGAF